MTPGARTQAIIDIIDGITVKKVRPKTFIDRYFKLRRYAGSSDRRFVYNQVYSILRHVSRLKWWLKRSAYRMYDSPRAWVIAHALLVNQMNLQGLKVIFSGGAYSPTVLSDTERQLTDNLSFANINHTEMPDYVKFEFPAWIMESMQTTWGSSLINEIIAFNQPAPIDLRVNTLKTSVNDAMRTLNDDLIEAKKTIFSPIGLRLNGPSQITQSRAYKMGLAELQDEGSQLISLMADAQPGLSVVDFCAGAGGKTLSLASTMAMNGNFRGRLLACDISKMRLQKLQARSMRAGITTIESYILPENCDQFLTKEFGNFDRALVDVPCSNTGTWRRNPMMRWHFKKSDLDAITIKQFDILSKAAKLVSPGGKLIYATCSFLKEENEFQIKKFLEKNNNFHVAPDNNFWIKKTGQNPMTNIFGVRLSPATTGTDGFFCSVLQKI